jgi:MYXO-CTERM domain-containing protein
LCAPGAFQDQSGPGELDVLGALAAVDRMHDSVTTLPDPAWSWISLAADVALADGSTPVQAIVEVRSTPLPGAAHAAPADGFGDGRLAAYASVDGARLDGSRVALARRGPGVWVATIAIPGGLGGSSLTVGATFDGTAVARPVTIPIATDTWDAAFPASVRGGCAVSPPGATGAPAGAALLGVGLAFALARRRRRAPCS